MSERDRFVKNGATIVCRGTCDSGVRFYPTVLAVQKHFNKTICENSMADNVKAKSMPVENNKVAMAVNKAKTVER
ncbi:MAG: hypothetical protein MJ212_03335 [Alphaproteobacteria bacterium]|nr:hypothetical protein [Alphaproteobacteria bacterium]